MDVGSNGRARRRLAIVAAAVAGLGFGGSAVASGRASVVTNVAITAPTANQVVSGTVLITAAVDPDVTSVKFVAGSDVLGVDGVAPFELTWDTTTVADGANSLRISATRTTGRDVQSTRIKVVVNNANPAPVPTTIPLAPPVGPSPTAAPAPTTLPPTAPPAPPTTAKPAKSKPAVPPPAPTTTTTLPAGPARLTPAGTIALPGRGLSIAWSPDGAGIAAGGHFRDKATQQRYDTRTIDVPGMRLGKSFGCHYWWAIAQAWTDNPYIGEVIADGGGDHSVKIFAAESPGSGKCNPGMFEEAHGGVRALYNINGWITALAFSPDGRYLAGVSRDRAVRIWQIEPGPDQWRVVRAWYDKSAGNLLSVRWSPDGTRVITGDRNGKVAEWEFTRWDPATIALFTTVEWEEQSAWFPKHPETMGHTPLWSEGGHKAIWNVRYSPDGTRVAAAGTDGVLSVYEARTGAVVYRANAPKNTPLHGLDWSPDGALLAAGADDDNVYVFDAATGRLADTLRGHATLVTAVAWSPDGRTLASTAGGQLVSLALNEVVDGPDNAVHLWTRN